MYFKFINIKLVRTAGSWNRKFQQNTVYPIKTNTSWVVWRWQRAASTAWRARPYSRRDTAPTNPDILQENAADFSSRRVLVFIPQTRRERGTPPRVAHAQKHHDARKRQQRKRSQTYLRSPQKLPLPGKRVDFNCADVRVGLRCSFCASLCACSAPGTNPARLRLHNS